MLLFLFHISPNDDADRSATTSLHLDILSDLKRIHSHICSVGYPVLEAAGELPAREPVTGETPTDAFAYRPKLP